MVDAKDSFDEINRHTILDDCIQNCYYITNDIRLPSEYELGHYSRSRLLEDRSHRGCGT